MTDSPKPEIVIFGGRSLVAEYLMDRLAAEGLEASVISRRNLDLPSGFKLIHLDISETDKTVMPKGSILLSLAPIWVLARNLQRFSGAQAIVALSSISRYSKAKSQDAKERMLAENIEMGENILTSWAAIHEIPCTILRSNMIYDGVADQNISRIARFIKKMWVFPLAGEAKGLRQPIHADDVAAAIMGAIGNSTVYGKSLNIAGGQVLSYREMVKKIFRSLDRRPLMLHLPTSVLKNVFAVGKRLRVIDGKSLGYGVFERMNENMVFDCEEGRRLLRYSPRPFEPEFRKSA